MKAIVLAALMTLVSAPVLAAGPFDGTWKIDVANVAPPTKPNVYLLLSGEYSCRSCAPPFTIPADGAPHAISGNLPIGIGYSVGIVTNQTFKDWEFNSDAPPYVTALDFEAAEGGPLQSTHQELQFADASHLSGYLSLNYHGIPGLVIGGAAITGSSTPPNLPDGTPYPGQLRVSLWEGHARWTPGRLDLSVLYAGGHITNTAAANAQNQGVTNPIPASFEGFYAQGAYTVYQDATFKVTPFVRWETYNLGSSYEGTSGPVLPAGPVAVSDTPGDVANFPVNNDQVWTFGVNWGITQGVVVKADYQIFANNTNFDRFDLGLGLAF